MTTASLAGMSANAEAKVRNLPNGWPTFLAILPQVVGLALGLLFFSVGVPAIGSLALGVAAGFGTLMFAMMQAGHDSGAAASKALKYTVLYCVIFPIELIGGAVLLLFYVIPYLLVATIVTTVVINGHSTRLRERFVSPEDPDPYGDIAWRAAQGYGPPTSPPGGPPTSGPPTSPPGGPPTSGPQTGPFFDPRDQDDPDTPAF